MTCVHLWVSGRVQGVFFRQSLKAQALRHSVHGWVRNLEDGRVEAVLEGDAASVNAVAEWCGRGPAGAIVHDTSVQAMPDGDFHTFDVLYG